ncbi:MAG TPA: SDR family NAD(P)-dependent oxidoreductase [Chryseosolibacter sp.]
MKSIAQYTIITGASSGLGKELALQCAAMKMNLILVALPGRGLQDVGKQLRAIYNVDVVALERNLTNDEDLQDIVNEARKFPINFLINNAGTGGSANFASASLHSIDAILMLNVRATALLTRLLIPLLLEQERSYVLNISSLSAFSPIGFKTVYPASKAFIYSFSMGLREEFRDRNLSVSASYPGPMITNADTAGRIIQQGYKARLTLLPVSEIARIALQQTLRGKATIIPGLLNRLNYRLMNIMPAALKTKMISDVVRKEVYSAQAA